MTEDKWYAPLFAAFFFVEWTVVHVAVIILAVYLHDFIWDKERTGLYLLIKGDIDAQLVELNDIANLM